MTAENLRPFEHSPRQDELIITTKTLWEDNHSPLAERRRQEFEEARLKGELAGVLRCSDARVSLVGNSISVGTISAAGVPSRNLARDRGIKFWMSLSHFDGDTVDLEVMPEGCGGLRAKTQIGDTPQEGGIGKYVAEIIKHQDPLVQAIITAEAMAYLSDGKPVLAASQDHLDHTVYPVAFFQMIDDQMTSISAVRNIDILKYDPKSVYENGIPTIREASLPDAFLELLEQNKAEVQDLYAKYPNIRTLQKVQKPRTVMFSTDIRSAKIKYPRLSEAPGSIFKVFVPREKMDGSVRIKDEDLINSFNQLQYPIDNAVKNFGRDDEPFSNTDRLIIETADIEQSRRIAQEASKHKWMTDWMNLSDRKIILVQTVGGVALKAEEFTS